MKFFSVLTLSCALLLLSCLLPLINDYSTYIKTIIAVLAIVFVLYEITLQRRFWALLFLIIAYWVNPFSAAHLLSKESNIVIDVGVALVFMLYAVFGKADDMQ